MVTVSGRLLDFVEDPSIVAQVQVRAREVRPHGDGVMLDHPVKVDYAPSTGTVTFDAAAGTAGVIMWHAVGRSHASGSLPIIVPEGDTATLRECVEAVILADEGTITALERLALEVTGMVATIQNITQLEEWADTARTEAGRAKGEADRAEAETATIPQEVQTALTTSLAPTIQAELDTRAEPLITQAVTEANAQIQNAVNNINPIVQWPKNAIGGAHLDTIKTPGQYWQDTKSVTTTANGYPFYDTCSLQVLKTSASDSQSVTQVVIGKETRQIGVRDCVAGTWSSWTVYSNVAIQLGATDLNTLTTGQTRLATVSAETGAPNMPANRRAVIRVYGNGASVTQRVYALQTPESWTRTLYGGTWSAWRRDGVAAPTALTVATDANTITESGDYIIAAGGALTGSANLAVQERQILSVTYEANYRVQTTTSLITGRKWTRAYDYYGGWTAWQPLALASDIPTGVNSTAIDSAGAGLSNDILVQDWSRRRGGIKPVTTGCVAFRFDHGLAKFDSLIRPLMEARNLPYSLALCSDQWHQPENTGITAATVDGWVQGGLCEVWNHSATHAGSEVEAEWRAQIVDSLVSLRAQIPSAQIDGFAIPGTAGVGYGDFGAGEDPHQFYSTPAGRTILATHAVSSGYIPGTELRILDGMIRQGQGHATLDSGTLASAQTKIAQAQAGKRGLQFMLHPNLMDDAGRITASTFEQILDHVVAERDAGRLTVLSPYDLMLARVD